MKNEWDVVIAGAGPAGAMLAICLSNSGGSVLLVDRSSIPRYKVCGGCLNLSALESLDQEGLGYILEGLRAPVLESIRLSAYGKSTQIPIPGGNVVARDAFDFALVKEAERRGAIVKQSTRAKLVSNDEKGCLVELSISYPKRYSQTIRTSIAVSADGIGGDFLPRVHRPYIQRNSRIGVGCMLEDARGVVPPGEVQMTVSRDGYVGVVQVQEGQIDVAAALDTTAISKHQGSIGATVSRILEANGLGDLSESLGAAEWKGTPPLSRRRRLLGGPRLFIIGDAAGYVEPFTGEGMAWALMSGRLVAPIVDRAVDNWEPDLVLEWQAKYRQRIRRRQGICKIACLALRNSSLTRFFMSLSSSQPQWVYQIVRSINRMDSRKAVSL